MVSASECESTLTAANDEADCRLPDEEDAWDPTIVLQYTHLATEASASESLVLNAFKAAILATWKSNRNTQNNSMPPFGFRVLNRSSAIRLGLNQ